MPFDPETHDFEHSAVRVPVGNGYTLARSRDEYDALTKDPEAEPKKAPAKEAPAKKAKK